ncbi:hypothetical protein KKC00_02880 [Patescibacteria group bacterium]|nr:hypothetical protein [Patescibacteria group bacterium]
MRKKIILFLIIFLFLFVLADFSLAGKCYGDADCPGHDKGTTKCLEGKCVRALEITYPKIGNEPVPTTLETGLPGYVKYVFTFSVALIGLVIFGVLIYNGILYLTSAGNPGKMTEARKGIFCGFLGGLILLSSHLIFNTINPQLMIMELPKIKLLEQVVVPGVYICNYKVDDAKIKKALDGYTTKTGQEQIDAAKELREIMGTPEKKTEVCPRVNFSGNFQKFEVTKDNNTIFIVPSIEITEEGRKSIYQYGIVLHEKDNFGGQAAYYPRIGHVFVYDQITGYSAQNLPFIARSVTLFQKPSVEPVGNGVTLYKYFNYNRDEPTVTTADEKNFKPVTDIKIVALAMLGDLKENTRSITFSPAGSYFALLCEGENLLDLKRCKLLHKNNPNLMDIPIGMCPTGCKVPLWGWLVEKVTGETCAPCLNSMIVIKGSVL